MTVNLRTVLTSFLFCALLGSSAANGDTDTILKLSLGNTGPDLEMVQMPVPTSSSGLRPMATLALPVIKTPRSSTPGSWIRFL